MEVIRGEETSSAAMDTTIALLSAVGKHPVRVEKDVPGFVGNRLQHALWREAISIVENGIAEPAVVDEVIKFGFGIRLPVLGPLENADMVGLDLTLAIHNYILKHIENSPDPSPAQSRGGRRGWKGHHRERRIIEEIRLLFVARLFGIFRRHLAGVQCAQHFLPEFRLLDGGDAE